MRRSNVLAIIQIRLVGKSKPATVTAGPDGSYGCTSYRPMNAQRHAVIPLRTPLGTRDIVVHHDQ